MESKTVYECLKGFTIDTRVKVKKNDEVIFKHEYYDNHAYEQLEKLKKLEELYMSLMYIEDNYLIIECY